MVFRLVLYNAFLLVLGILVSPWIIYQLIFVPKRRKGLAQRFGFLPSTESRTVWCHAVSVGEVRAISSLLSLLQEDERTRNRVVLSTVTPTGQETAQRECGFVNRIIYFPLDLPLAVNRGLGRIDPEIFITAETEIWPNFFAACFLRKIPVVVVNGRISDRSFPRYLRFRWFFRPFLERVDLLLMQSEEDARRILEMGARPEAVKVTGNMKYDRTPESVRIPEQIKQWAQSGFLLVAGSTHAGEEEIVLEVLKEIGEQNILLALVPRHPERFGEVGKLLGAKGLVFSRYTEVGKNGTVNGHVLLVDAMGLLDGFYALADAAFVGGSLVPVGGHNLLEPAAHGVPVLTGAYIHNFRDIADALLEKGGCFLCDDGSSLLGALRGFLEDNDMRENAGQKARAVYESAKGASKLNRDQIFSVLGPGSNNPPIQTENHGERTPL